MKYRVTGLEKPQHSRVGLLIPGAIVELNGADEIAKASQIRYLEPMNEDKENIICQKNEKQSQPTRKASYGGRKQLSTKPKENF